MIRQIHRCERCYEENDRLGYAICSACLRRLQGKGFTLIELMIVVVLIGILVMIGIPAYGQYKRQAHVTAAISQLRHLHQAQEHYYLENSTYSATIGGLNVQPSEKIPITMVDGSPMGWSATAQYRNTIIACAIFYGTATIPPPATAADEGEPVCSW